MARTVSKTLVLAVGIIFSMMLIAGCEEEAKISDTKPDTQPDAKPDTQPDTKRSRLIAIENAQLKAQIEKLKNLHDREMQRQKELHDKESQRQQQQLDSCLQAKAAMEEMSKKGVEEYMQNILGPISEENTKLREEIETLKAQNEKLKTELEEAKK
jgi:hypothetical protein